MEGYREIGRVVRLQIQRKSLKQPLEPLPGQGRSPEKYYDPEPIAAGEELWVADNVAAIGLEDHMILDVHCAAHPHSRNRGNGNMLSIGFTSHYDKTRERFGPHLTDGIAGENILVESDSLFDVSDLASGLAIRGDACPERSRGNCIIRLDEVIVATPCVEFSRFCLGDRYADPKTTSQALRFLDGGTRGFYAYISTGLPATLKLGDTLSVRKSD